jgi:hypothetical protein
MMRRGHCLKTIRGVANMYFPGAAAGGELM